jgi:hypothetical protein
MSAPAAGFGAPATTPASGGLLGQVKEFGFQSVDLLRGSSATLSILYALLAGVIIAVTLLTVDYYVPFLPINPISGPSAAARAGKKFWTNNGDNTENLIVVSGDSPTTLPDQYSMSVQMVIADSRTPDLGRFRHVLHRGANPCNLSASKSGSTGHAGIKPADIPPNADPSYTSSGLPPLMNPGLMLDNYKNDLHIFVHTRGFEGGEYVLWLESMTVEDLPLNTPVTVGVICNGQALEVYVNCRLYGTLLLRGKPYLPTADNVWFGRYCAYPFAGLVKNLQLWGSALSTSDYVAMCSGANFSGAQMPSTCPTAGTRVPSTNA